MMYTVIWSLFSLDGKMRMEAVEASDPDEARKLMFEKYDDPENDVVDSIVIVGDHHAV